MYACNSSTLELLIFNTLPCGEYFSARRVCQKLAYSTHVEAEHVRQMSASDVIHLYFLTKREIRMCRMAFKAFEES